MEDVVFAGTAARPPLGRAEVLLTIDNSDGALPIEYAEVTIARTMFRNGGSDYAINGTSCRLLDIQELLSDSGIGREMHVVVGQGQLDAILHATPEERRGFVEEAAGVLKHRKRKEKALRKLDATEANLTRLGDLLREIRRQLKPLGRQAEIARRASVVQMAVRDSKARLLADDVVSLRESLERELADGAALHARRRHVEAELARIRRTETELEAALSSDAALLDQAQQTWFALAGLRERVRSTESLAAERIRHTDEGATEDRVGRDPADLEAESSRVRASEVEIAADVTRYRNSLAVAVEERQAVESAHSEEDRRTTDLVRKAADHREWLAHLTGEVNAVRSRLAAADEEIGRLASARTEAIARADKAQHDFTALETRIAGLDAGERGLDAEHEISTSLLVDVDARLAKLREEAQTAERERASLTARREALEVGLSPRDGASALLGTDERVTGLMGSLAAMLTVRRGYETAVAAALGSAADGVAVADVTSAVDALAQLKGAELGRTTMVIATACVDDADWPQLPADAEYAIDVIDVPDRLEPTMRLLLRRRAVVEDLDAARRLVTALPDVVAVTQDGDVLGGHLAAGGSPSKRTLIEVQAAVDEAAHDQAVAAGRSERLRFELANLQAERVDAQSRVAVALAKLHESDAALAAVAEELGQYGSITRSARAEASRIEVAIAAAHESRDADARVLDTLSKRLAQASTPDEPPGTGALDSLAERVQSARQHELEARLALRTVEERAHALRGQADALTRAAEQERAARTAAVARRARLREEGVVALAVRQGARIVLARLDRSAEAATARRRAVESDRAARHQALAALRSDLRRLEAELAQLTGTAHREELARAEHRLRIEQLEQRAHDELGLDLESLVTDYGPGELVPAEPTPAGQDDDEAPNPMPYVREEQQRRLRSAERALAQLGRINPLALEEFSALEERHAFLSKQLDDLRKTRRDLLDIVAEVDNRVHQVFTEAYADVEREFTAIFARLFPGGDGRLVLTDPTDLLATGIDVEARPAGKKIKRLSLLSGGERSLVAVAFLVSLFKARPSPFYILDEVEAALDDTNLGRLLEIYEELRETSQLLVITHQKRTMEIADALYGISMRGDGVSAVISQRLRDAAPA